MRTPPRPALLLIAAALAAAPSAAQVKADLGAGANAGSGSAAAGAPLTGSAAGVAPLPSAALAPLTGAPALSAASAPSARLAPAAALPSAAVAAPAEGPRAAAAPASPPSGPPAAAAAAPPSGPPSQPFVDALKRLGAPEALVDRLEIFLQTRHPGDQGRVYHGLGHSHEVANAAARVAEASDLPVGRKALLIVAAALHDVDPERTPDTPARVAATLEHLDGDDEARALLTGFGARFGFTPAQVKALIMATDFSMAPAEMQAKKEAAAKAAAEAFPGEDFGAVWGRRLAFVDQSSTYVGPLALAKKRVMGLAHEIRSNAGGQGPSDAQMLAGTAKFLAVLRQNPDFAVLPADLRANFEKVQAYFEARQAPEAWAAGSAPASSRAPPDVEKALRYVKSIAGGLTLDAQQTDGLLSVYFEEQGIRPGSEKAEAIRRALVPSRASADDARLKGVSAALSSRRAILLRLAAKHGTTPARVEAVLQRRGVLAHIDRADDEVFEQQADRALARDELERAVARYPDDAQGEFLRGVASAMASPSGKSVEEVARDGVFGYVDFSGETVLRARAGRDPDVRQAHMVFYITRDDGRWRIGGYRQNASLRRSDDALIRALKAWLTAGGIPEKDLE